MKRSFVAPLVAVAIAVLVLVPTAVGHSPVPNPSLWAAGGSERFKPAGAALSSIRFFADLHISVYTRLTGQPAGVRWIVQLYDKGTCTVPKNYIANLGTITPGEAGAGARTVFLDAAARDELLDAIEHRRTIVLRLTRPGLRVCLPFSVQRPGVSPTSSQASSSSPGTSTSRTTTRSSDTTSTGSATTGSTSTISTMPTTSPRPTRTNTNTTMTTDTGSGTTTTTGTQTIDTSTTSTDVTTSVTNTTSTTAASDTTTSTATATDTSTTESSAETSSSEATTTASE